MLIVPFDYHKDVMPGVLCVCDYVSVVLELLLS